MNVSKACGMPAATNRKSPGPDRTHSALRRNTPVLPLRCSFCPAHVAAACQADARGEQLDREVAALTAIVCEAAQRSSK